MRTPGVHPFRLGAIILAAGASSRMGRPKLLLPWGGTSILGHLIAQWQELGAARVAVVCTPGEVVNGELDRLGFPVRDRITNADPDRGMFSSIQCAARWDGWSSVLTHWVIGLGDQPQLPATCLRRLVDFAAERPGKVCQPSHHGAARHPVIVPKEVFGRLSVSEAGNLKQFLQAIPEQIALCELDEPALDIDLDTPADYERALRTFHNLEG